MISDLNKLSSRLPKMALNSTRSVNIELSDVIILATLLLLQFQTSFLPIICAARREKTR